MLKYPPFVILISLLVILCSACSSGFSPRNGGGTEFNQKSVTVTKFDKASQPIEKIETVTTDVLVRQPENPKAGGGLSIVQSAKGDIKIGADTSGTLNTDVDLAAVKGLNPVTYTGIFLILAGVGIGILTKGRQLLPAAGLGVTGVFLIALAFLIPSFKGIFLIAIGITIVSILGYIFYSCRKMFRTEVALEETITTVDELKPSLDPKVKYEIFNQKDSLVKEIQCKHTRKIIDKKRGKR